MPMMQVMHLPTPVTMDRCMPMKTLPSRDYCVLGNRSFQNATKVLLQNPSDSGENVTIQNCTTASNNE